MISVFQSVFSWFFSSMVPKEIPSSCFYELEDLKEGSLLQYNLQNKQVRFKNGIIWKVGEIDSDQLKNLLLLAPKVALLVNGSECSLLSQATGPAIPVELHAGPLIDNALHIESIDTTFHRLYLSDGKHFQVTPNENLKDWRPNDAVFIGMNQRNSVENPVCLINVQLNQILTGSY